MLFAIVVGLLAFISVFSGGMFVMRSFLKHRENIKSAVYESIDVIKVLHKVDNENRDVDAWKQEVSAMEQLLTTFTRLQNEESGFLKKMFKPKPRITLEIAAPSNSEEISFFITVPKKYSNALEKQVHSYFSEAEVEKIQDYTIFSPGSEVAISNLKLKESYALPLQTYEELERDLLNEITTAISKLDNKGEGASIQLILQKAPENWMQKGKKIAQEMQKGKRLDQIMRKRSVLGEFLSVLSKKKDENKESVQLTPEEQELIKIIQKKASKSAYSVNIRLAASAKTKQRAQEILSYIENSFVQLERHGVNRLVAKNFKKRVDDPVFDFVFRVFDEKFSMILGVEEIASIFHFPISTTKTPNITKVKSASAPAPIDMPTEGTLLGYNLFRGKKTDIILSRGDRRRHLYVIGQTGAGKSAFLQEIAKQDVKNGEGLCFIDPHGDAIDDIMTAIPKERAGDVIYFDPSNYERPFGLNMMEFTKPEEKGFVVNEILNIFDKLYDLKSTGGPMFEQYMRNAILLVMEDEESGSTLMEIPKVLADEDFRKMKLSKCKNISVKEFWEKEAQKAGGDASLANMVPYITSKLTPFLSNDMMRPIISQQKSTINFREAMDTQKILLVNLSKGKIGEQNSYLLGMIIIGKLLMAALGRVDMAEDERKDFYLFIDEFQNVTTDSISQILSEARKYRLSLTIAHQFIGQLSDDISKAVFGNVGSMTAFRVGAEDAEFLEKQFSPVFSASDLINVDNYKCFAKILVNNKTVTPFSMNTYPPTKGSDELVDKLKELSALRYGRDRKLVEEEVQSRTQTKKEKPIIKKRKEKEHYWR